MALPQCLPQKDPGGGFIHRLNRHHPSGGQTRRPAVTGESTPYMDAPPTPGVPPPVPIVVEATPVHKQNHIGFIGNLRTAQ